MRKGGERRLRYDVGAKAQSKQEAEVARALVDQTFLQYRASDLISSIVAKDVEGWLTPRVLSEVAHKLINDSLERMRRG
jgi:hypothetical protein